MPKIPPSVALEIHELRHKVTQIRLGFVAGHDELWGALGAAGEALDYCTRLAQRDVDPSLESKPTREAPKPKRKRSTVGSPARGAKVKGLVK